MRLTWGVATLRAIVINMHTWASRLLKPRIQACVLQALVLPYTNPEPRSPTPDIDVASMGIFNTPEIAMRSSSRNNPSNGSTPIWSAQDNSTSSSNGSQVGVLLQPSSPCPPASRISQQQRRFATPRRMHSPATPPPINRLTPDLTRSQKKSLGFFASTHAKSATAPPATSPVIDPLRHPRSAQQVDISSVIQSLESTQLDDSNTADDSACHQEPQLACDEGERTNLEPNSETSNTETIRPGGLGAESASLHLPRSVVPHISSTAVPTSAVLGDESHYTPKNSSIGLFTFTAPKSSPPPRTSEFRYGEGHRRDEVASELTSPLVPSPNPIAGHDAPRGFDDHDVRRSSCARYLVEYKGRLLKAIESLDSLREGIQGPFQQGQVLSEQKGAMPSE
jgi:hypothetical protein